MMKRTIKAAFDGSLSYFDVFLRPCNDNPVRRVSCPMALFTAMACAAYIFSQTQLDEFVQEELGKGAETYAEGLLDVLHDTRNDTRFRLRYYAPLMANDRWPAVREAFNLQNSRNEDLWRTQTNNWQAPLPPALS